MGGGEDVGHHQLGDVDVSQDGSEEELETSGSAGGQTPKKRKLDSIRAGLPAHGLRITQSQVMRMLKMIQEVRFTTHPLLRWATTNGPAQTLTCCCSCRTGPVNAQGLLPRH